MNKRDLIKKFLEEINSSPINKFNVMEVCGTHTQSISKFGIRNLVESKINLISGPGCPVCVTSEGYIDAAIEIAKESNVILATFGDMMKVKGSKASLIDERSKGKDIRILYSPLDSINLAEENKDKEIVFLAVGFETTAPIIALTIKMAKEKKLKNISFLIGIKKMEPILNHILKDDNLNIHGFICPGHVATITGANYFKFIVEEYNIPAVVTGFSELDIIGALYFLTKEQMKHKKSSKNLYKGCVTLEENLKVNSLLNDVFINCDNEWRGIGDIKASGFILNESYNNYDAAARFQVNLNKKNTNKCACNEIILGKKKPSDCKFFGISCTPENAIGPCMVSSEGACSIFYKYNRR
ncbi:MAG: hydrogenase formation protein HypD [Clostridium sp.]|uniref:hydrogenase formation protein HypD n=1 Tax=Clostridium sp. TaxID=1506 RepID=UPI002A90947A|nr:hydrogenase formation protein HypD [Clostridium sp.]MDY6228288.1 hydrogenase formation protein HypD [Clostridium sp.]